MSGDNFPPPGQAGTAIHPFADASDSQTWRAGLEMTKWPDWLRFLVGTLETIIIIAALGWLVRR